MAWLRDAVRRLKRRENLFPPPSNASANPAPTLSEERPRAERREQVEALFKAACLREPSQRVAFLKSACGGDEGLRNEVAWLLTSDKQFRTDSGEPSVAPTAWVSQGVGAEEQSAGLEETAPASEKRAAFRRGDLLGRYIVLERLGSGGMGVVYAAYDPELNRKVAIKLLQLEASEVKAEQGPSRMLREAQALARLSHPNIIPVFDVGTWGEQVFIAMEYLDGQTLKDWLGDGLRPWREVLSVFLPAGRGLAAAHAAGLVHRDFKPSNVFIGKDGRVRVLDFGLARAADAKDSEPTRVDVFADTKMTPRTSALAATLTESGLFIGTPAYMAPEQLMQLSTDQRSDQFSFCAALYEGLYGERPFAADKLETLVFEVTKGKVKEAPKASKVPAWLRQIVLRGLRPNPDERYPSMDALITELEKDPAIVRQRWLRASAAAILIGIAVLGYRQVKHQQSQLCKGAENELAGIWSPEKRRVISEVFLATGKPYAQDAVNGVQKALDGYARAWVAMHTEACEATRVKGNQSEELLDLRMQCLSQQRRELQSLVDIFASADGKVVERSVQTAQALTRLDDCADADALKAPVRPPADAAIRTKVEELRQKLATAKGLEDAGKYREGVAVATSAATEAKALQYRPLEAEALLRLGTLQSFSGDAAAAERTLTNAVLAAEAGRHDAVAAQVWIRLVWVGFSQARYEQAHEWGKLGFAAIERLGGDERLLAALLYNLGTMFSTQGKYDDALDHIKRALAINERIQGPNPGVAASLNNIGNVLLRQQKYSEALPFFQRALSISEQTQGPSHPDVALYLNSIGLHALGQGKYEEALPYLQRSLAIQDQVLTPLHPNLAPPLHNIGLVLLLEQKYKEALPYFERALEINETAFGREHPNVAYQLTEIGKAYVELHAPQKALEPLERALSVREREGNKLKLAETQFALARALDGVGRERARARKLAEEARKAYANGGGKEVLAAIHDWLAGKRW